MAFGDRLRGLKDSKLGGVLGNVATMGGLGLFKGMKSRRAAKQAAAAEAAMGTAIGAPTTGAIDAVSAAALGVGEDPAMEAAMGSVGYANSPGIPGDVPMNDVAAAAGPGGREFEQMDEMGNPIAKKGEVDDSPTMYDIDDDEEEEITLTINENPFG